MKYHKIELKNGAKLYYVKNILSHTTKAKITFDCGARCDTIPGIAHFTEHLFFTGTKSMSSQEVKKKYFDFIGTNAYTNQMEICFSANVFTKEFEEYVKTVAMLINETTFSQKAINKELPVIKQEIAMYKDKYDRQANDKNNLNLTGNKTYLDYSILGTEESVSKIKSKDVKDFVKKYFVANNMHIYVTSPLSKRRVKSIVENNLVEKLKVNNEFKELSLFLRYANNKKFYDVEFRDIGKCYYCLNFVHNNNLFDWEFRAKYSLLLSMLNDTAEGVMKRLREEEQLVYGGYFWCNIANDKEYVTSFSTDINKANVDKVTLVLADYLKEISKAGFTKQQLDKAKRLFIFDHDNKEPTAKGRMNKLEDFRFHGKVIMGRIKKLAKKVTVEQCNELFNEIFINPTISLSIMGNVSKNELMKEQDFYKLFN